VRLVPFPTDSGGLPALRPSDLLRCHHRWTRRDRWQLVRSAI